MSNTNPNRITVAEPVRAITTDSATPAAPANPETDPHAAAPAATPAPTEAPPEAEEKPAARKGK